MSLGKRLKAAREKKGYSQLAVAKKTGISNANISNYERDYRKPEAETIRIFAELYDVTLDYLIGGKKQDGDQSLDDIIEDFKNQMKDRGLTEDDEKKVLDAVMEVIWESRNKG